MSDYREHSRFLYLNYDEIQDAINNDILNAWDMVICQDSKEIILIKDDLSLFPIKSKVYRYASVEAAENAIKSNSDTYAGQIIAVLNEKTSNYEAYIVNQQKDGSFKIDPINKSGGNIDYDTLGHIPIVNLYSDVFSPAVLDTQKEGVYRVIGAYKISESISTIFDSYDSYLFLVHHDNDGNTYVKKVGSNEIIDYTLFQDGTYSTATVPTTDWLKTQNYATEEYVEGYVDDKISNLEFITQQDLERYVNKTILEFMDTIDQRIETVLDEKMQFATPKDITNIFRN